MTSAPLQKARRRGLNRLKGLRSGLVGLRRFICNRIWGMDIHPTAEFSLSAKFDRTFPIGVHVGPYSFVAPIRVCSLILPGVEIGDNSVIGAGSVVTKSVPARSLVAGNTARILREGIEVGPYGRFLTADATEAELASAGLT